MLFNEFGEKGKKVILCMHGMCQNWQSEYEMVKPLEKEFRLIIPAMDGFYDNSPKDFTNFADQARQIEEYVKENYNGHLDGLVGHSKCGVCLTHATSLCNNPKQIILVTISTPFKGTCLADGEAMRLCLKKWYLRVPYSLIFSNHPVDKDIAPESSFITKLKPPLCKKHINIVTTLDCNSQCNSIVDRILLWWNKQADLGRCDGFVPLESQKTSCDQQFIVPGSHAQSIDFVQKIEELLYINQ